MEKKKVLIIDDEENFTHLVKLNLEETGRYEVKEENRGAAGLVAAKQFKPDLILLDVLMPDLEGSEVAHQLQNDKDTKDIPIVFLTVVVTREETVREKGVIGGHPFIAKPASANQIMGVIERIIGQ